MLIEMAVNGRQKLTKKLVDALMARQTLWDAEVTGFGARKQSRDVSFVLKYSFQGRQRFYTIGRHGVVTLDQARNEARRLLGLVASGVDPASERDATPALRQMTVGQLCESYLTEGPAYKPSKKASSWYTDRSNIMRHIQPLLGAVIAGELTEAEVVAFVRDVIKGASKIDQKGGRHARAIVRGGAGVAARALAVLSTVYTFGARRKLVTANPTRFVKAPKGKSPGRFLDVAEWQSLGAAMASRRLRGSGIFIDAILLLALTGCRRSEITRLRWAEVDLAAGLLALSDSKSGPRVVPLGDQAIELLAKLKGESVSQWVFPSNRGAGPIVGIQKVWEGLRIEAGIPSTRLHDLRHSFASQAVNGGASLYMTGAILGHRQSSTTQRYAHIQTNPARIIATDVAESIFLALSAGETL